MIVESRNIADALGGLPRDGELLFPMWPLSREGEPPPRVSAFRERPLAFIGAWEPLSFRTRAGYAYTDEEEFLRESEFSDAAFARHASAGASSIIFPFAKGFGLAATAEELAQEKDAILRAKARGLLAGAYIRVDIVAPELLRRDCPDVEDWLAVGMDGLRGSYSLQQTWRKRVCFSHVSAARWLEKLLAYGVRDLAADYLHLDGCAVADRPWETCRCPLCLETYRRWLRERFADPKARRKFFGIVDFEVLEFPEFSPARPLPTVLSSADMQAWYLFQWERGAAFMRHIRRFVRDLSPDVAVTINPPGWGRTTHAHRIRCQRVEPLLPWVDMVMIEDSLHLRYKEGAIRSRIGIFKTAREYDVPVGHYHWLDHPKEIEASLCLSLAANGGNAGCLGFSFRYLPHFELGVGEKQRLTHWAGEHQALLRETRPHGSLALLRHFPSLAWNGREPWVAAGILERLLLQMHVPWRMLDRISEDALRDIQTLLLPDAESLSDRELDILRDWTRGGGRLFFTGRSGTHNEFRRRRPRAAILSWTPERSQPADAARWYSWCREDFSEGRMLDGGLKGEPWIEDFGSGKLGYWPTLCPPDAPSLITHYVEEFAMPENSSDLEAFIRNLHGPFSLEVHGPPSILMESATHIPTGDILLHVLQTDIDAPPINLDIHCQDRKGTLRVISPDSAPPRLERRGETLALLSLARYAVLIFSKL